MTHPLNSDQRRAFLSAPDPRRYYAASAIEESRQRIVRAIARSEGPVLVVGAVGTGKSLLMAVLAEQFEPRMSVVTLPGAQLCTRRALLQMILSELHLPYRHMDEGELRLSILEHLRGPSASHPRLASEPSPPGRGQGEGAPRKSSPPAAPPRRMLLLVDEADALPTRLLEELRVLTNVVSQGVPLVNLVLAGSPVLEERFADPQLDKFSQRVAARCYLAPLSREETFQFMRSQVSAVGVRPEAWFDPEALAAVHSATGGVPRLVNQLGDQLVWLIEETGCQPLDAALVQQAWSDLQQLPAPWNTDAHSSLSSPLAASVGPVSDSVIEFGELDDGGYASAGRTPTALDEDADEFELGGDDGIELFKPGPAVPMPRQSTLDDDLPASIPIATARGRRDADLHHYTANIDATERLVDQLDEFELLELAADPDAVPEPTPDPEPTPRAAENPFDERFDDEEVIVDPYSEFESHLLRNARHVLNRIDRTFAAELARCELRKSKPLDLPKPEPQNAAPSAPPVTKPAMASPLRASEPSPTGRGQVATGDAPWRGEGEPRTTLPSPSRIAPLPPSKPAADDILVVDIEASNAAVVPGRNFRRLFTSLEAVAAPRAVRG